MTDRMLSGEDETQPIRLQIVAAGNGWWVRTGPDPSEIATYVFVDVEERPELLELPARAGEPGASSSAEWIENGATIRVQIDVSPPATLEIAVDRPELEAVRHARLLYICPTTPRLGLSPFLARDRSVLVRLPRHGL